MGNPILGERAREEVAEKGWEGEGEGKGEVGLPHVEGAHELACVRRCSHGHGLACERAQGLNFNYFLFGRYNISMLGGAWPTERSPLAAISVK